MRSERTSEKRAVGRGSLQTECYYIDDRQFVNVVTYRVQKMQQDILKREQQRASDIAYTCPNCLNTVRRRTVARTRQASPCSGR